MLHVSPATNMKTSKRTWRIVLWALLGVAGALAVCAAVVWKALRPPRPLTPVATEFTLHGVTIVNPGAGRAADQTLSVAGGVIRVGRDGGAVQSGFERMYVLPGL